MDSSLEVRRVPRAAFVAFVFALVTGASACGSCAGDQASPDPQKTNQTPATSTALPKPVRMPFLHGMMRDASTDAQSD